MTSEEIKKQIQPLLPRSELFQLSVEAANAVGLLEIAYQLAVMNERTEPFACNACGGPRRKDQAVCDDCFAKMNRGRL